MYVNTTTAFIGEKKLSKQPMYKNHSKNPQPKNQKPQQKRPQLQLVVQEKNKDILSSIMSL